MTPGSPLACENVSGVDLLTAATSGMLAGLGVALPLGAISVLLLGEGVTRGFRAGAPAALAVGTVDTLYCAVAESFSITLLRLKVPGFWRGGNSLKLCSHRATYVWAGPSA